MAAQGCHRRCKCRWGWWGGVFLNPHAAGAAGAEGSSHRRRPSPQTLVPAADGAGGHDPADFVRPLSPFSVSSPLPSEGRNDDGQSQAWARVWVPAPLWLWWLVTVAVPSVEFLLEQHEGRPLPNTRTLPFLLQLPGRSSTRPWRCARSRSPAEEFPLDGVPLKMPPALRARALASFLSPWFFCFFLCLWVWVLACAAGRRPFDTGRSGIVKC